ncbi:nitrate/nitrite transporter [Corynebacterium sp.]|uniref:nitrate/nitrite transporter n=1 Tax=Corynebacterium sp. TaxID=1720 RepID=UPI002A90873B|nr:MFS transporter [Corynebacterium sp.]MDY5786255.1 MFS transporter [Corynebacterium sp.]
MTSFDSSQRVLHGWDPEDPEKWDSRIAQQTLWISTVTLFLGFATWYLVSAIAPHLNNIGFDLTLTQLYWLTSVPGLTAGLLRLVWMFLPPILGTRKMVTMSALLFIIPMVGWGLAVRNPETPYGWLLALAFMTGLGGGVYSGFMPSTAYFFPKSKAGTALGLQAGLGNLGMSAIQLVAPWLLSISLFGIGALAPQQNTTTGESVNIHNIAFFFIPWVIVMAIVAWIFLKDVPVTANFRQQIDIFRNKNTWLLTLVFVMTFGSLAGISAQLALLMRNSFDASAEKFILWVFMFPLVGALTRAAWGPLCDKFGGAIWTFTSGIGLIITAAISAVAISRGAESVTLFFFVMLVFSFFAGMGNAGATKQMPMILPPRQAGGVMGWTGAIASFGPFFVGVFLSTTSPSAFFWYLIVYYIIVTAIVWYFYARPKAPFPG